MLIDQDPRFRKIPVESLLSSTLSQFTSDIFHDLGGPSFPFYIHRLQGPVRVGGGELGSQVIDALEPTAEFIAFALSSLQRLGSFLDIDFRLVSDLDLASFVFYIDSEINIGSGLTLGLAVTNSSTDVSWWEVFLNGPALQDDFSLFKYAFLHEAGHLLGLEHPFDSSDGDLFGSSQPQISAYPEESVMAYRDPVSLSWPDWYSPSDVDALVFAWGLRAFDSYGVLSANRQGLMGLRQDSSHDAPSLAFVGSVISSHSAGFVPVQSLDRYFSFATSGPVLFEMNSSLVWQAGYSARNVGSPTSLGTGQSVSVAGLLRNQATFDVDSSSPVGISMPAGFNSSVFADDIFSAFASADLLIGSSDVRPPSMLRGVTDIFMSTAGGTSLVDLTSAHFEVPSVVVWGASDGLSMFWGGSSSDRFVGQGGDAVIFGGMGSNSYSLGSGREVLQYRSGVPSMDLVYGFDWRVDAVELWSESGDKASVPSIVYGEKILTMQWDSNTVDFVLGPTGFPGQINLSYSTVA